MDLRYKNGRLVHGTDRFSITIGDTVYDFTKLENAEGKFVFIQEKEQDELRLKTVKGGIMIKCENLSKFIEGLKNFAAIATDRVEIK